MDGCHRLAARAYLTAVPNVVCPRCSLASYVARPHSAHPLCPHCDTDLFAVAVRPVASLQLPAGLSATTRRRPAS
jgi:transposase-like protein